MKVSKSTNVIRSRKIGTVVVWRRCYEFITQRRKDAKICIYRRSRRSTGVGGSAIHSSSFASLCLCVRLFLVFLSRIRFGQAEKPVLRAPSRQEGNDRLTKRGALPAFEFFFDLADDRRVPPHEGVVREIPGGPALAVEAPCRLVGDAQSARILGGSLRAADAVDPARRERPWRAENQPAAARRVFCRASGGFVVDVHLAMLAVAKGDVGGGAEEPHPLSQFFSLSSSSSKATTVE